MTIRRLFLRAVLLAIIITVIVDLRLSVKVLGDGSFHYGYFVSYLYQRLSVEEITSVYSPDAMGCVRNCIENERCLSVNLAVQPDADGNLLCQLLATNQFSSPENLGHSKEFHFYSSAAAGPCLKSSCQNGGMCRSIYDGNDFVCECPTGFRGMFCEVCDVQKGWQQHDDTCYKFFTNNKTWDEAKKSCEELGASLLTIHSARENNFVTQTWLAPAHLKTYIALRDFQNNGTYTWADNSNVNFVNWATGEPNLIGLEHCAHMYNNGLWNNVPCSNSLPFVCEK